MPRGIAADSGAIHRQGYTWGLARKEVNHPEPVGGPRLSKPLA
jgi:hypothetical protein